MRTVLVVVVLWGLIFGVTVGARRIAAAHSDQQSFSVATLAAKLAREIMSVTPGATGATLLVDIVVAYPEGVAALESALAVSRERLRSCKNGIMNASRRPIEHFEISFVAKPEQTGEDQIRLYRIEDVLIERGTVELTRESEACVLDAFSGITATLPHAIDTRLGYPICFNKGGTK